MPRDRFSLFFVYAVPIGLLCAVVLGVVLGVRDKSDGGQEVEKRASRQLTEAEVLGFASKIIDLMPERHPRTAVGEQGLTRTAAMISGTLSPENAGYALKYGDPVNVGAGKALRPIMVQLAGDSREYVRVMCRYDGDVSRAPAIAAVLSVAQSISNKQLEREVRFIFQTGSEADPYDRDRTSPKHRATIWVDAAEPEDLPDGYNFVRVSGSDPVGGAFALSDEIFRLASDE